MIRRAPKPAKKNRRTLEAETKLIHSTRRGSRITHEPQRQERRADGACDGPSHHAERGVDGADVGRGPEPSS